MNVVVAIDSFKGSLSSVQAGNAVKEAILQVNSSAHVSIRPLADGGEGTVATLSSGLDGTIETVTVSDPLSQPVSASYFIISDSKTAVIEMAAAAGITLIAPENRDPLLTTTYGVGEMIRDAIHKGCRHFIIGIGGSATNDGGTGMLSALGYTFLDYAGKPIPLGAKGLEILHSIACDNVIPELRECTFRIACDVTNPLCGENGCSQVFAPQKGGTAVTIPQMDKWLEKYALLAKSISPAADWNHPGAGAAGGLGFAFLSFTNATLQSGVEIILEETRLEEFIRSADIVVTGEGRLDSQTVMGKAPIGVAKLAKKYGKSVIAFSGCVTEDAKECNSHGIDAYFPIIQSITTLEEALEPSNAYKNLVNTASQVFRLLHISFGM